MIDLELWFLDQAQKLADKSRKRQGIFMRSNGEYTVMTVHKANERFALEIVNPKSPN